jgi:hypothetical protein
MDRLLINKRLRIVDGGAGMVEMLLLDVTMSELANLFEKHKARSPAPYLLDEKAVTRARRLAKK